MAGPHSDDPGARIAATGGRILGPFAGLRPARGRAQAVVAPPYDVVSADEARAMAAGNPLSFFHVSRAEIDLAPGQDPYAEIVYGRAGANLRRMVANGVLVRDAAPSFYAWRMRAGDHVQTGIAAAGSVRAYEANRIRRHELTRPEKEMDRVRQIEAVNAHTGPVMAFHRHDPEIAAILAATTGAAPATEASDPYGVEHAIWPVVPERAAALGAAFDRLGAIYIADGHHRSAAALKVAERRRRPGGSGAEPFESFLIVSFPETEMRILDYNRVVRDLGGLGADELLRRIGERFDVARSDGPARPRSPTEFGMYLAGRWHRLALRAAPPADAPPLARLTVNLLTDNLLAPILGIGDQRSDKRIDFVGGSRGLGWLARLVDSGEMAVAFALYPTSLDDLMAVADAGEIMPPKSTWFEPKLADGLLSLPLD